MFWGSRIDLKVIRTTVLEEFKEQLTWREDGKYETALPWKASHPKLPTNLNVARPRFQSLLKRQDKQPALLETYHQIIEDQVEQGIVEIAPIEPNEKHEHYIPHKPVVRERRINKSLYRLRRLREG
jgi:hypothetical protein